MSEMQRSKIELVCPKHSCEFVTDNLDIFIDHVKEHGVKTPGIAKHNGSYTVVAPGWRD